MCALTRSSTSILPGIWSQFLHQLWIFLNSLSRFFWPQQHTECHPPSILEKILESLNINNYCSQLNPEINCSKKNLSITSHLCSFALKLQKLSNSACIPGIVFCCFFQLLMYCFNPQVMDGEQKPFINVSHCRDKEKETSEVAGWWGRGGGLKMLILRKEKTHPSEQNHFFKRLDTTILCFTVFQNYNYLVIKIVNKWQPANLIYLNPFNLPCDLLSVYKRIKREMHNF